MSEHTTELDHIQLRPFFTYFGGKYRAAPRYPRPTFDTIVEPFAGSAGYALRYPHRQVVLVERDHKIAAVWRYLLNVSPGEVRSLPLWGEGWETTDDLMHLDDGARWLIGLWLNKGQDAPRKRPSGWMRSELRPDSHWGAVIRERIATQVPLVRHWRLIEGDYRAAPNMEATWFIDPPYDKAGVAYRTGSSGIDYTLLADWCRGRIGQVMVCEAEGASWLPFAPLGSFKSHPGRVGHHREVLYVGERQ